MSSSSSKSPPSQSDAPSLGPFQLLEEKQEDAFGRLYLASSEEKTFYLRVLSSTITNDKNFVVRFELCHSLPPKLKHPALLSPSAIDKEGKLYYLATPRQSPHYPPQTLANASIDEIPIFLEQLCLGLLEAFDGLQNLKLPFYPQGLPWNNPSFSDIFLSYENSLIGGQKKMKVKLAHFLEPFLFFGDEASSLMRHHLHKPQTPSYLQSPSCLLGKQAELEDHLYTLGAIIYQLTTNQPLIGSSIPLRKKVPSLHPLWEDFFKLCFENPSLSTLKEILKTIQSKRQVPSPHDKILKYPVPKDMVLLYFPDKVQIGNQEGHEVERPACKLPLKPFFMDVACTTNAQMQAFLTSYKPSTHSPSPDHPATNVSLNMAKAYCDYRSEKAGLAKGAFRLPTEFEWEAACRGGSSQLYPWGDSYQASFVHAAKSLDTGARPVKSMKASPQGLYEMLGNIWEWTESRFIPHPYSEYHDPRYKSKCYTIKGGSWISPPEEIRASARQALPANERKGYLGFRCVLDPAFLNLD